MSSGREKRIQSYTRVTTGDGDETEEDVEVLITMVGAIGLMRAALVVLVVCTEEVTVVTRAARLWTRLRC